MICPTKCCVPLGSRYCDTQRLSDLAWSLFGRSRAAGNGCRRSATTCMNTFSSAISTRAATAQRLRDTARSVGVCRDFAHLAVTLCRCMNIPARYCTGYLGDIGVPKDPAPMDFSAWFEVFLGGQMVHLRCPAQRSPDRAHRHCARPGCGRCCDLDPVRQCGACPV